MEIREIWPEFAPFAHAMELVDGKRTDRGIEARVSKNSLELRADGLLRAQEDMGIVSASNLGPDLWILQ